MQSSQYACVATTEWESIHSLYLKRIWYAKGGGQAADARVISSANGLAALPSVVYGSTSAAAAALGSALNSARKAVSAREGASRRMCSNRASYTLAR